MEPLTQCEYQVAHEVAKGHTPSEIAELLQKSIWTIKAQIRDIHKKLGINNNVELTLFLLFSVWFVVIAVTPDYQMDMRRCRVRSNARTSVRATRSRKDCDSFYII